MFLPRMGSYACWFEQLWRDQRWFAGARLAAASDSEAEDEGQRFVDRIQFGCVQMSGGGSEPLWVDQGCLLDEDARLLPLERDRRTEARRTCACRGRRNENGGQVEKLVRLDNYGEPCASLLVAADAPRSPKTEDLAPNQVTQRVAEPTRRAARGRTAFPRDRPRRPPDGAPRHESRSARAGVQQLPEGRYERLPSRLALRPERSGERQQRRRRAERARIGPRGES